jgi:hypothetical protein
MLNFYFNKSQIMVSLHYPFASTECLTIPVTRKKRNAKEQNDKASKYRNELMEVHYNWAAIIC